MYKQTKLLGGAGEACWAHNPKVRGSKPLLAIILCRGTAFLFAHNYLRKMQRSNS